jgi:hypothetical protein
MLYALALLICLCTGFTTIIWQIKSGATKQGMQPVKSDRTNI